MDILNQFFLRKGNGHAPGGRTVSLEGMPLTLDQLKDLIPIRSLDEQDLATFAHERRAEFLPAGTVLFGPDSHDHSVLYLLKGTVETRVGRYRDVEVEAGTPKARFPLCCGAPQRVTARAKTDVHVLRVSADILKIGVERQESSIPSIDTRYLPTRLASSNLVNAFVQALEDKKIDLPVLPSIALKLSKAIERNVDIAEAAGILQLDPVIAAHIVRIANCPLYLPARPIATCHDAIVRLGLPATRNLVLSLTVKQMFRGVRPFIAQALRDTWKRSVYLSSLCYVLAAENQGIHPEEALLAGLVCDIGAVPFLTFAEKFPLTLMDPDEIGEAIPYLVGPAGARVLDSWEFLPHLAEIPLLAEDWFHDSGEHLQVSDIVMLARLHSYIGTPKIAELPPFSAIPAVHKLKDNALSPEHSLKVFHQAREKIAAAMKLFD